MGARDLTGRESRVAAAIGNLRVDATIGEVVVALESGGVRSLLLKGPTLSDWYPREQARVYHDGDIWVRESDLESARAILTRLGFQPGLQDHELPSWWDQHAICWERGVDGASIDLHRTLDGIGLAPDLAWDLMWAESVTFEVGGRRVRRLSEPGRIVNVVLHSAQHGLADPKATAHVEAALLAADRDAWSAAAQLADELDARAVFVAGVRAVPAGRELADELELAAEGSVRVALLASGAPPISLGFMQLAQAPGWGARMKLVVSKIAPPPTLLCVWWPPASRGSRMLALGYVYRPLWLIRRAPAGFRAWRAAKRAATEHET